ncbi:MAG: preprotein translocase subunit SecG [Epsilonproteobacteria bacterium]|nr:preprotein translocase subunit SecG [Campylobacterota bacterium]
MTSILLILQFALAVILTIVVLLQKSSSIGLGAYSGSNESVFGAKGPAGFLTKITFALGLAFVINTLALGYFYNQEKKASIVDNVQIEQNVPASPVAPVSPISTAPQAPSAPDTSAVPVAPQAETNQSN